MQDVIEMPPQRTVNLNYRQIILAIEAKIKSMPGALGEDPFPLRHSFAKGIYIRELLIPKGYFVVGKLHRGSYFNCVLSGDMSILTEEGVRRVKGPCWNISPDGMKRFGYSHEDTVWVTVHSNPDNITDIETLENMIHAKDYDELPQIIDVGCDIDKIICDMQKPFDVDGFRELTKRIFEHEKDGFWSDWTKEQQDIYMSGDWEAFSRSRGYSEQEISDLREWIRIKEDAESLGINALELIKDLALDCALKNIQKDTNGEILLSSHIPSSRKTPYKKINL